MALPEGRSRGEHDDDAPLPTDEQQQQHLYLIFDDWAWGYSIRKLELPPHSPHHHPPEHKCLPHPCICLEAPRHHPSYLAAVGTNIIATHHRRVFWNSPDVYECILPIPIFDIRSPGVRFGLGLLYSTRPLLITVGDEVFAMDMNMDSFSMRSMNPSPPFPHDWSWCDLPPPPFKSTDVTSFAVGSDGCTIFASTERATFAFDIVNREWKQPSKSNSLPFAGPAYYVRALDIFVGLSSHTYGHLCFCNKLGGDHENVRLSKENLLFNDPAEGNLLFMKTLGATLVYLGGSSDPGFCLVECISTTEGKSVNMRPVECDQDQLVKCVDEVGGNYCGELDDQLKENVDVEDGAYASMQECGEPDELNKFEDEGDHGASGSMLYRLTTFSLSFDNNGDLTTGETCVVQYYKVPQEVSEAIYMENPGCEMLKSWRGVNEVQSLVFCQL